jgi:hypothetical protein
MTGNASVWAEKSQGLQYVGSSEVPEYTTVSVQFCFPSEHLNGFILTRTSTIVSFPAIGIENCESIRHGWIQPWMGLGWVEFI